MSVVTNQFALNAVAEANSVNGTKYPKIDKSSNINGSLILKYQWIQKGVKHHYIWPTNQTKGDSSLKTRKTLCNGVTAELINKKIKIKFSEISLPNICFKLLYIKAI